MKTVAVVGGGVSGLAAAEALERRGRTRGEPVRAVVLESEPTLGGKVATREAGGCVVELGPHGFLDKDPAVMALIDRLGLGPRLLRANEDAAKRFVLRAGKLREIPGSPPGFITSDILPLGAKLRIMMEPLVPQRVGGPEESVHAFASRRIGSTAADVLVDAMVTGIYGGDPRQLSLPGAFPAMAELEAKYGGLIRAQFALAKERKRLGSGSGGEAKASGSVGAPRGVLHSFDKGLKVLVDALARDRELRTGARVLGLSAREGGGFDVQVEGGPPLSVDAVYLTAPAFEIARLLAPLDEAASRALAAIPYAPVSVVVHVFDAADVPRRFEGFGFLAPAGEGADVLGSIWASTVFAGHAPRDQVMLRTLVGGVRRPELARGSDQELGVRVRRALARHLGISETVSARDEHVIRWPAAIPQYNLGHLDRVAAADAAERRLPGLFLGGNGLRGVAMVQCLAEGERAAARIEATWAHS